MEVAREEEDEQLVYEDPGHPEEAAAEMEDMEGEEQM